MRKRAMWNRLCAVAAAIAIFGAAIPVGVPQASAIVTTCTIHAGDNVGAQDYTRWSSPVTSYLTPCGDGLMRVQYSHQEGVIAEYYDAAYNLTDMRWIPAELPLFGAFYETADHYYLLTGQRNPEESAAVECYRLTKYDKQWNRLGSAGLYDCNTCTPFDAGSARIAQLGKYLVIRTSHEMYMTADGLHHQANLTMQVDTDSMMVSDSFSTVWNESAGYVSHSFNQFIAVENNRLVTVDHGDAYPRSVVLMRYGKDASDGMFGRSCANTTMVDIPGNINNNDTGVSVGGFAVSDTAYLVAGNRIDLSTVTPNYSEPRSIFVSVADKASGNVTIKAISDAADGGASTPHMVAVGGNVYLLLWEQGGHVCYTKIDGNGDRVSDIYRMDGWLSDCVPIVFGGKVVWYTWDNAVNTFYEISLSDLTATDTIRIENGHRYENRGVTDGVATLYCPACGETTQVTVVADFSVWWNQNSDEGYYWNTYSNPFSKGDKMRFFIDSFAPLQAQNQEMELEVANPSIVQGELTGTHGVLTMVGCGSTTVTIRPKYNPAAAKTFTIIMDAPHTFEWVTDREPTEEQEGVKHEECTVCGYVQNENTPIDRLPHTHVKADAWTSDESGHWHVCTGCGDKLDAAAHTFEWVTDREPTEEQEGVKHEVCTVCGYVRYENTSIPPLSHTHTLTYVPAKEPTREEAGNIAYWHCAGCDKCFLDEEGTHEVMLADTVLVPIAGLLGDVNGDGKVDSGDALQLLRYAAEIITGNEIDMTVADLNGDGKVDSGDALLSLQYAAEIIHEFPAK